MLTSPIETVVVVEVGSATTQKGPKAGAYMAAITRAVNGLLALAKFPPAIPL